MTVDPTPYFPESEFTLTTFNTPLDYDILTIKAKDFLGLTYKGHHPSSNVKENWSQLPDILTDVNASFASHYSGLLTPIRDYFFDINDSQTGALEYISACEVFDFGKTPKSLTYKAVPQRTYLKVIHTESQATLNQTDQHIFAHLIDEAGVFYEEDYVIEKFVETEANPEIHIYVPITTKKLKKRRL